MQAVGGTVEILDDINDVPHAVADYLRNSNLPAHVRRGADPVLAKLPWHRGGTLEVTEGRGGGRPTAPRSPVPSRAWPSPAPSSRSPGRTIRRRSTSCPKSISWCSKPPPSSPATRRRGRKLRRPHGRGQHAAHGEHDLRPLPHRRHRADHREARPWPEEHACHHRPLACSSSCSRPARHWPAPMTRRRCSPASPRTSAHTIELCAVRDDAAGGFQSLQYRYGTAEKTELVFPENRDEGRAAMSFAHAFDGNTYVWSLRFGNDGYTYRLFGMGEDAGVEVWRKKKRLAQVMCGERPYAMAADIRKAAGCDLGNPFGKAGCGEVPRSARSIASELLTCRAIHRHFAPIVIQTEMGTSDEAFALRGRRARKSRACSTRRARSAISPPWCRTSPARRSAPKGLARLKKIKPESLPLVRGKPRIGACIANPQKFIAIGLNYSDHAAESGLAGAEGARRVHQAGELPVGPLRRRDAAAQVQEVGLGGGTRRHHRHQGQEHQEEGRARTMSRAIAPSTISPSANSRRSAPASGPRASPTTPSAPSAPGW